PGRVVEKPSGARGLPGYDQAAPWTSPHPSTPGQLAMLSLKDLRLALEAQDPELVRLIEALAVQPDEPPATPVREGVPTFDQFLADIRSWPFRRKSREEQAHYRIEQMKALEAPDAEAPLPDRLRLHEILLALWRDDSVF